MPIRSWFGRYYAKKYFLILVSYESRTKNHNIHDLGIYFCIVAFEIGRPARWYLWNIQKPGEKLCGGGRCGWLTMAKGLWNLVKHQKWTFSGFIEKWFWPPKKSCWVTWLAESPVSISEGESRSHHVRQATVWWREIFRWCKRFTCLGSWFKLEESMQAWNSRIGTST